MWVKLQVKDERERLIVEQALLAYREVEAAGAAAEHGRGLAVLEEAVLDTGRRQMRRMLEEALRSRAEAQKGGAVARVAAGPRPSSVPRPRRSSAAWAT